MAENASQQDNPALRKTIARVMAVQGLYSDGALGEASDSDDISGDLVKLYYEAATGKVVPSLSKIHADRSFFKQVLAGVREQSEALNDRIVACLDSPESIKRMSPLIKAILQAATFELQYQPDTPPQVVIHEYVMICRAFFDEAETGLVNAVLDRMAKS